MFNQFTLIHSLSLSIPMCVSIRQHSLLVGLVELSTCLPLLGIECVQFANYRHLFNCYLDKKTMNMALNRFIFDNSFPLAVLTDFQMKQLSQSNKFGSIFILT